MRLSMTIEPELAEGAARPSKARSKRQAVEAALKEFIHRRRVEGLIARAGRVPFALTVKELLKRHAAE